MSKSVGGFLTLQKLVDEGYDPLDYRYFLLGGHYRSQLQFSWDSLTGAKNARRSLMDKIRALAQKTEQTNGVIQDVIPTAETERYAQAFNAALEDDLNTPRALAELWDLARDSAIEPQAALAAVFDMDEALGLGLRSVLDAPTQPEDEAFTREIETIITQRAEAKKAKDFDRADSLRDSLKERGIILEDGPGGTAWRRQRGL